MEPPGQKSSCRAGGAVAPGAARFRFKPAGLEFTSSQSSARQQLPRPFDTSQRGNSETLDTSSSHYENLALHAHHQTRRTRTVLAATSGREGQPGSMVWGGAQGKLEKPSGTETGLSQC